MYTSFLFRYGSLCLTLLLLVSCSRSTDQADLVVSDVNVVDVENGTVIKQQDVFVKNGLINKIEAHPSGITADTVIHAAGQYLIPGLWDFHVHFRGGDSLVAENRHLLNLYLANGVTTVRDAGGDITPAIMSWRKKIAGGTLIGPKIYTSGPKLDGSDPTWAGSIELESVSEVPAAIDSLQEIGADYVKVYASTISQDVYIAAIKEAEQHNLKVTGHMPYSVSFRRAVKAGLDATEHMYYVFQATSPKEKEIAQKVRQQKMSFGRALMEIRRTYEEEYARETYKLMTDNQTGVVPTMYIMKVLGSLATVDHSQDTYLQYIGPGIEKTYQGRLESAIRRHEQGGVNIYKDLIREFSGIIKSMQDAGVTIYAGSDAGPYNSFVYPGVALHKELQQFADAGLSPAEILRTATIQPAQFFGVENETAQVREGFQADLVLLNANPLKDVSHTQLIDLVIVNGKQILNTSERERMLKISEN